jgi:hypothetical protein
MKLDAAIQVAGKSGESLYPSVEVRFKLGSRWYRHLYSADGIERLLDASHDNLTAQSVEETLVELSPELRRNLRVHVHADDDF